VADHQRLAQDVGLQLHLVEPVLDHVADADVRTLGSGGLGCR
jgi:hypothetical protein